jgi:hypothetical protein
MNAHMIESTRRDRRHLNHMDADTKAIHNRLECWGEWARSDGTGVGWPAATLLGRMIEFGPQGAAQEGRGPVDMPGEIAVTDAAVARLGVIDKSVIRAYYIHWAPPEVIWKRCAGIRSFSQFKIVLRRARWRVGGFLDGFEYGKA